METMGVLLLVFGGIISFCGFLGLACVKDDENVTAAGWADYIIFLGLFSFIRGLARGIKDALSNRHSSSFSLLIILCLGLAMSAVGYLLL